ncbi:MAG TPA: amidohydrolase [Firmicutes bacterium]|nr:amidohydrolase [Bacillota bacterium]
MNILLIDTHIHVMPPDMLRRLDQICAREPYFAAMASSPKARFVSHEEVLNAMRACEVTRAVIFGYAMEDQGLCREINDYVCEVTAESGGALIGFMVLNPAKKDFEAEFENCIARGLQGVGELFPEGQKFDLLGKDMSKLAGLCREAKVPLMIHVNEQLGHSYAGKTSIGPVQAWKFAKEHPGLNIVYPHLGGGLFFYELMREVARDLRSVWYDTAAVPFLYSASVYKVAKDVGAIERLLLGTDYPLLGYERYWAQLRQSGLLPADQAALCGENALRLLRREGDAPW